MTSFATEWRLAWRVVARRPAVSAAVVIPIGLAIALTSALFSVLDGVLFRPLPFDRPSELVTIGFRPAGDGPPEVAYLPALQDRRIELRDGLETGLAAAAQAGRVSFFAAAAEEEAGITATGVDARFFRLLGLRPVLGDDFRDDDERNPAAQSQTSHLPLPVIISDGVWQRLYGGDPDVLGVRDLAGRTVRIVGVMGPGVKFPGETNVWAPVASDRPLPPAYGRLAPGVTATLLASRFPELEITPLRDAVRPGDSRAVVVLFAAAGLLLLVAWIQVAGLVFSGAVTRLQEIGVRLALGASRGRLVRQFAVENALLAAAAFALAWLLAGPLTTFIVSRLPAELTLGQYLAPDGRTVVFAAAMSLLGLALLTLLPVDLVRRAAPLRLLSGRLADTPFRAERARMGMLAAQMAFTAALLYVAGLAVHSFVRVTTFDYGFDAEHVLVFTPAPVAGGGGSGRPIEEFLANSAERKRQLAAGAESLMNAPGVVAADVFSALPLQRRRAFENQVTSFDGQAVEPGVAIHITLAGPRFIEALGARLVAGHGFDHPDYAGLPQAAVINETLARRLSTRRVGNVEIRRNVLDRELRTRGERFVITGVVRDLVQSSPGAPPEPQLFSARVAGSLIAIRTTPPVEAALPAVRTVLQRTFGDLPPRHFGFLRDELREVQLPYRGQSMLLGLIAAFCLPLAGVGLTGALLYFVQTRTRETAIRMALGADPADVRRAVVRRALAPVGIGIVVGTAAGIAMGRIVASQLFQVHPADPLTIVCVAAAVLGLAWLAALLPARLACRVDPAVALRNV